MKPEVPFRFYVLGFRDFVMTGKFAHLEDSDAASCFLSLTEEKLERQPGHILPIIPELLPAIRHVEQNQTSFDADDEQGRGERSNARSSEESTFDS